ncbi:hypothetical protein GIW67_30285, partial [Pseudomonas lactis]|nr:hypothetical protein [Pseudomonas lactis]
MRLGRSVAALRHHRQHLAAGRQLAVRDALRTAWRRASLIQRLHINNQGDLTGPHNDVPDFRSRVYRASCRLIAHKKYNRRTAVMALDLFVVLIYAAGMLVLGYYGMRRAKTH